MTLVVLCHFCTSENLTLVSWQHHCFGCVIQPSSFTRLLNSNAAGNFFFLYAPSLLISLVFCSFQTLWQNQSIVHQHICREAGEGAQWGIAFLPSCSVVGLHCDKTWQFDWIVDYFAVTLSTADWLRFVVVEKRGGGLLTGIWFCLFDKPDN